MPEFKRLVLTVPLAREQAHAVQHLMDQEGLCKCGRFLKSTDAKLCLSQINTAYFPTPKYQNTIVISAFCYGCASKINDVLKFLKGTMSTPEPDATRHEG